jgi:NAD+ kinase
MGGQFKTIGIIGKPDAPNLAAPIAQLVSFLRKRALKVVLDTRTAAQLDPATCAMAELDVIGKQTDLVIVVGGDGTMLGVARKLAPQGVPIIGVNLGRLGFLTDIPFQSMEPMVAAVLDGEFVAEDRMLLHSRIMRGDAGVFDTLALNDVVVSRGSMGSMIELDVYIDGQFSYNLRSDGLIVSTPTGSTAYSLSSGGPILHPQLDAISMVPISPHTLSNRPIVVAAKAVIEIALIRGPNACANFDVQSKFDLLSMDKVVVQAAAHPIKLLHPKNYDYYSMLREKLHWSAKL